MTTKVDRISAAKGAAVRAMARRDLTRQEVTELLGRKGYDEPTIEQAVLELEAEGVVDDARVSGEYARRGSEERGLSRAMIEATLLERGVEAGTVDRALSETLGQRDEKAEALEIARERVRRGRSGLEAEAVIRRVFQFLRRRGYDEDVSLTAAEQAAREYLGPATDHPRLAEPGE